jgi:Fe-S-cluster containining protein
MLQELETQVLEVYRCLDGAVAGFSARSHLSCAQGCGHCCTSEKVEATVLECIPLAFELFRTFQAELIIKRLEKIADDKRCILYRQDFSEAGLGGCTQYRYRVVVCRLFGFAGNRNRDGIRQLAVCRVMKNQPGSATITIDLDDPDYPMPLFAEAGMLITTLHQAMGTRRLPINSALLEALQKVGIFLQLSTPPSAGAKVDTDAIDDHSPDEPHSPRTRRQQRAA